MGYKIEDDYIGLESLHDVLWLTYSYKYESSANRSKTKPLTHGFVEIIMGSDPIRNNLNM